MKKLFTTAVATAVLLTSAVPAFAQDSNQVSSQTAARSKAVNPSSVDLQSSVSAYVTWNSVPGAVAYEIIVYNHTDGYEYERSRQSASVTNKTTGGLTYGKNYSITVAAVAANGYILANNWTGYFTASPTTNWFNISL
ncbi:hypothetical protein P4H70_17595 [Paenibacillus ehimensis]|uniref:hypothetical protein n=1 Tax=Paenibacillus ehimensis TaxID=79264 RepID=UPI002DB882C2|nr:hypothetical protein [Paenibacillus ehimensis]MEC0210754.1 hypothetical protein [Paenibacillus ehimensis]